MIPAIAYGHEMVSAGDGVRLALHRWTGGAARAAVFYIHGIQSHAGWLHRTGPELARRGVDVYALDRRGSGRSSGPRGHLPSADLVLEDYRRALVRVRHRTRGLPVTAVGQSLGGSVLAALLTQAPAAFDGAVWCAPALGQQRRRHAPERLAQLRVRHGIRPTPVTLSDADYTDEPADLAYMATDNLMPRQITDSTRRVQVEWEDMYMSEKSLTVGGPAYLALPRHDPIIDLACATDVLQSRVADLATSTFDTTRHYVEFTSARTHYWDWLTGCTQVTPSGGPAS